MVEGRIKAMPYQIPDEYIDETIGQLAILAALGYSDAGMLTTIYTNAIDFDDTVLEQALALEIECIRNEQLYDTRKDT
jgi:hypothetical protein